MGVFVNKIDINSGDQLAIACQCGRGESPVTLSIVSSIIANFEWNFLLFFGFFCWDSPASFAKNMNSMALMRQADEIYGLFSKQQQLDKYIFKMDESNK